MKKVGAKVSAALAAALRTVRMISVEPIIFALFVNIGFMGSIYPRAMRTKLEQMHSPGMDTSYTSNDVDDYMQRKVVTWGMVIQIPGIALTLLCAAFLGAHSDRYGRQFRIALAVLSETVGTFVRSLVYSSAVDASMWLVPASHWQNNAFGGPPEVAFTSASFLADSVVDKEEVAIRIGYMQGFRLCGTILGTFAISRYYHTLSIAEWHTVALSAMCFAMAWTLYRVPQAKPKQLNDTLRAIADGEYGVETPAGGIRVRPAEKCKDTPADEQSIVSTLWSIYKAALATLFRKRAGCRRMLVLISMAVYCSITLSIVEGQMSMGVYTMQRPLSWQPDQYAQWAYTTKILDVLGTVAGIHIMKKCFHWPDTYVILVGLASTIAQIVPIAFVHTDWHMYIGSVLGMFDGVTMTGLTSYGNHLLGPQEMGRYSTAGHIVASTLALALHGLVLQPLYIATLDTFPGCYLLVTAGVQGATAALVILIHVVTVKTDAFHGNDDEVDGDGDGKKRTDVVASMT